MHTQKSSTVEKVWMGRMELPKVVRRVQWRQPDPHAAAAAAAARGQEGGGRARREARVSRHTPITLLNTDTSNIRAMVQQFTGIPLGPYGPGGGPVISFGGEEEAAPITARSWRARRCVATQATQRRDRAIPLVIDAPPLRFNFYSAARCLCTRSCSCSCATKG